MHHGILIKVLGDTKEEAKNQVETIIDDTLHCPKCNRSVRGIDWDYVGGIMYVTQEAIAKYNANNNYKWKDTPEEIAESYIEKRKEALIYLKELLKERILLNLLHINMPRKEAPLYIDNPCFKKKCEEVLKTDSDEKLPQTMDEIANLVTESLSHRDLMTSFYMSQIEALQHVLDYGDSDEGLYTLHCTDNHYADQTENTEGKNTYYFWCDRHH